MTDTHDDCGARQPRSTAQLWLAWEVESIRGHASFVLMSQSCRVLLFPSCHIYCSPTSSQTPRPSKPLRLFVGRGGKLDVKRYPRDKDCPSDCTFNAAYLLNVASPEVSGEWVKTRCNMVSALRLFKGRGKLGKTADFSECFPSSKGFFFFPHTRRVIAEVTANPEPITGTINTHCWKQQNVYKTESIFC